VSENGAAVDWCCTCARTASRITSWAANHSAADVITSPPTNEGLGAATPRRAKGCETNRVPLPAPLRWRSPLGHVGMHRNFSIEFRRAAFQEVMQINHAGCREIQRLRQRRNGVEQFKCLSSEHPLNPFRVPSCKRNDLIILALRNLTARIIL
jgi:hypothetical protein